MDASGYQKLFDVTVSTKKGQLSDKYDELNNKNSKYGDFVKIIFRDNINKEKNEIVAIKVIDEGKQIHVDPFIDSIIADLKRLFKMMENNENHYSSNMIGLYFMKEFKSTSIIKGYYDIRSEIEKTGNYPDQINIPINNVIKKVAEYFAIEWFEEDMTSQSNYFIPDIGNSLDDYKQLNQKEMGIVLAFYSRYRIVPGNFSEMKNYLPEWGSSAIKYIGNEYAEHKNEIPLALKDRYKMEQYVEENKNHLLKIERLIREFRNYKLGIKVFEMKEEFYQFYDKIRC